MSRLCGLLLVLVISIGAQAEVFVGVGQSVLIGDQRAQAEALAQDVARSDAMRQAIRAYAAREGVDAHTLNLKMGELLAGDRSFLRSERLASADFEAPLLKLELEIDVDMGALGQALGLQGVATAQERKAQVASRPSIVVIVAEELNGGINSFPYSVGVIQERLIDADYELVDSTAAARATKHDQAVQAMFNNDSASAQAIALQFGAGITVTGRAIVQVSSLSAGGMSSYGANVALSAIATDTGRVLASTAADSSYPHVNAVTGSRLAVENAAADAVDQLISRLSEAELATTTALRLNVDGVNFEQLSILKRILERDFPEVAKLSNRGFGGDVASLDLTLTVPVVRFAESLAAKDFGSFKLRVLSQSASKVDTTVVMR